MGSTATGGQQTEHDKVVSWRLQVLTEAGYSGEPAERIAERVDVDLHRAVAMIRLGCSPHLAAEILL